MVYCWFISLHSELFLRIWLEDQSDLSQNFKIFQQYYIKTFSFCSFCVLSVSYLLYTVSLSLHLFVLVNLFLIVVRQLKRKRKSASNMHYVSCMWNELSVVSFIKTIYKVRHYVQTNILIKFSYFISLVHWSGSPFAK